MPQFPARCARCEYIFFSGMHVENVTNLRLGDGQVTCPRCGGVGIIPKGAFDVGSGPNAAFTLRDGEPLDPTTFAAVGLILIDAVERKLPPSRVVEEVEKRDPSLAEKLRAVQNNPATFAILLGAMITACGPIATELVKGYFASSPPAISQSAIDNIQRMPDMIGQVTEAQRRDLKRVLNEIAQQANSRSRAKKPNQ